MRARPFPWLRMHILGLLMRPSQFDALGRLAPANRLQEIWLNATQPATADPVSVEK